MCLRLLLLLSSKRLFEVLTHLGPSLVLQLLLLLCCLCCLLKMSACLTQTAGPAAAPQLLGPAAALCRHPQHATAWHAAWIRLCNAGMQGRRCSSKHTPGKQLVRACMLNGWCEWAWRQGECWTVQLRVTHLAAAGSGCCSCGCWILVIPCIGWPGLHGWSSIRTVGWRVASARVSQGVQGIALTWAPPSLACQP
jgi:hypothetical protein